MKVNFNLEDKLQDISVKRFTAVKGDLVLSENTPLDNVIFITKGKLRLFSHTEKGRQLSLHYLEENDICLISASCAMGNRQFPVSVEARERTEFVMVNKKDFYNLISQDQNLLELVLSSLGERILDLMENIKDHTFLNLRQRVVKFLLNNQTNGVFLGSHEDIAFELGTSREVISRSMKSLVSIGCIKSSREKVSLLKTEEMKSLCD